MPTPDAADPRRPVSAALTPPAQGGERLTGGEREEWISPEPRMQFQADLRRRKRY